MPFAPAGLITLTTDFGTKDPFAGSVHLAVVDPGVGTARGVVLAHAGSHVLLAPDNGLLPEALRDDPDVEWRVMDPDLPARLELGPSSPTFHGRDLFGPLAAALASGALPPADFGRPAPPEDPAPLPRALQDAAGVVGQVVLADHFGNLFTSIHAAQVAGCRQPTRGRRPRVAAAGDLRRSIRGHAARAGQRLRPAGAGAQRGQRCSAPRPRRGRRRPAAGRAAYLNITRYLLHQLQTRKGRKNEQRQD